MSLVKITSDGITDGSIVNADLHSAANIASSKLADSGVTAGSYGSATAIPAVTVNAKGIVTAVSTNSVNTTTNLDVSTSTTAVTVTSSTGNNATISEASGSAAGVMSVAHHDKLDGIESGATADQTASEILAALLTVDGTSSGIVAQSAGFVDVSGITTNANLQVVFSTSNDGSARTLACDSTNSKFTYNPSSNTLTVDTVVGNLTGNVTGNTSGSSGSCTGNAATATALATARTIAGVSFDGSANISLNNNAITNGAGYITTVADTTIAPSTIDMEDNEQIKLGTGDDLELFHNGSHSIVKNNTGDFFLAGNSVKLVNAPINNDMLVATEGGSVSLHHAGGKKFETTTSGATISGDLISTHSNGQVEILGSNGCIEITRTGGSPFIDFKNSTGEDHDARIQESNGGFSFTGSSTINGVLAVGGTSVSGNEGGEMHIKYAPNSSLNGDFVVFDQVVNSIRFFEHSGNNRGFYLDLSTAGNGVSSKIWHSTNDGASSGLDADLLDGQHGSHYLNYNNLSNRPSIPSVSSSQLAKAFVNLDQRSTQSIRNSYNVSSLTDNGTGKTTVNFSSGVGSNPTVQATSSWGDGSRAGWCGLTPDHTPNSSNCRIFSQQPSTYAFMDAVFLCVTVHRS